MTITLKVSENTKQEMIKYFEDKKRPKTPDYAVFQADEADQETTRKAQACNDRYADRK